MFCSNTLYSLTTEGSWNSFFPYLTWDNDNLNGINSHLVIIYTMELPDNIFKSTTSDLKMYVNEVLTLHYISALDVLCASRLCAKLVSAHIFMCWLPSSNYHFTWIIYLQSSWIDQSNGIYTACGQWRDSMCVCAYLSLSPYCVSLRDIWAPRQSIWSCRRMILLHHLPPISTKAVRGSSESSTSYISNRQVDLNCKRRQKPANFICVLQSDVTFISVTTARRSPWVVKLELVLNENLVKQSQEHS